LVAWQTPLHYGGDAIWGMSFAKAFMDGDISPVLHKRVAHLNAPYSANWNDFPVTEEFIFAMMGWLGRAVGLFPAANFMVLLAHLLAGLSFWYVCRVLNYRASFAFSGALLFAFSHYILWRNLAHISYTFYWHLPLMLLVTWWAYSSRPTHIKSRHWFAAITIAAVSGALNPYYTWMFLQFLGFGVLLHLVRKQYLLIRLPLLLIGVAATSFLIMNADTLIYAWLHGANFHAVIRDLAGLEHYSLKIPELVFPPEYHAWRGWAKYGQSNYFLSTLIKGESGSSYLGLVGLSGLVWLMGTGLYRLLQGKLLLIPVHAWQTLWVLLYSLAGGINLLLGTFGLILFRVTSRYSILILAIVLLFVGREISRKCPDKMVVLMALGIAAIGLWDQLPPKVSASQIQQIADFVQHDRNFAIELESQLPQNSMIFQLPVAAFPEIPPIHQMADYEHLRPYLFTRALHYSYGTNKGRGDADWQIALSKLSPTEMAAKLEAYGFGAIMINRKGYEDRGAWLINEFVNTKRLVVADNGELVAIRLTPAKVPILPELPVLYGAGWSVDEGTHRWAVSSRAEVTLFNNSKQPRSVIIDFTLMTLKPRNVKIGLNGKTLEYLSLGISGSVPHFKSGPVILTPGQNILFIETDVPPELPGTGDPRKLSFGITNFEINHQFVNK
jgi:phosphoglycerol transferase